MALTNLPLRRWGLPNSKWNSSFFFTDQVQFDWEQSKPEGSSTKQVIWAVCAQQLKIHTAQHNRRASPCLSGTKRSALSWAPFVQGFFQKQNRTGTRSSCAVPVLFFFFFFCTSGSDFHFWKYGLHSLKIHGCLCNSIYKANDKGTKSLSQLLNSVPPMALWQQTQTSLAAKGHLFPFLF